MATTVTSSIGSAGGRDYSTLASWEAACPANLVTSDQIWRGECYNDSDSFVSASTLLTISGITADSTRYIELTAGTGQSFRDHASVRSNALFYNQSNGVGIRLTGTYTRAIEVVVPYTRISNLQVQAEGSGQSIAIRINATDVTVRDCILYGHYVVPNTLGTGTRLQVINCALLARGSSPRILGSSTDTIRLEFCTIVSTGNSGTPSTHSYGTLTVENCAIFNFPTGFTTGTGGTLAGGYNCTDLASAPGSNNQVSKTFSAQFESTTTDFRAKTGGDLANGTPATSYTTVDISNTTRNSTTPYIGCWELVASGTSATFTSTPGLTGAFVGRTTHRGAFSSAPTVTGAAAGRKTHRAAFAGTPAVTPAFAGRNTARAAFTDTPSITPAFVGRTTHRGTFSTAPTVAPVFTGRSTFKGTFSSTPALTVAGVGRTTARGAFSTSPALTGAATGRLLARAAFGSVPALTGAAVGRSLARATFTVAADVLPIFTSQGGATGAFSSTATLTAAFVGRSTHHAAFTSAPTLSTSLIGRSVFRGTASSVPSLTAAFLGRSTWRAAFTAQGTLTGAFLSPPVVPVIVTLTIAMVWDRIAALVEGLGYIKALEPFDFDMQPSQRLDGCFCMTSEKVAGPEYVGSSSGGLQAETHEFVIYLARLKQRDSWTVARDLKTELEVLQDALHADAPSYGYNVLDDPELTAEVQEPTTGSDRDFVVGRLTFTVDFDRLIT